MDSRESFGRKLFEALFRGKVRDVWKTSRGRLSGGEADGLRLRLCINDPQIAALPWELLYEDDMGFLATADNVALSRYLPVPEPSVFTICDKLRVLVVVESPSNLDPIEDQVINKLRRALTDSGSFVEPEILKNATIPMIQNALNQQDYHVLHFLGHGQAGKLALVQAGGTERKYIADREFAQLVQGRSALRLIVLNACYSSQPVDGVLFAGVGPSLVKMQIPAVVAMQYDTVAVDTAVQFNDAFYGALAKGDAVDFAVNTARQLLSSAGLEMRDWSTPVLYMGTRQGRLWLTKKVEHAETRWSRAMVELDLPEQAIKELGEQVRRIRVSAQDEFHELMNNRESPPKQIDCGRVRVTVFLPENRRDRVKKGDVCGLFIPPKLHQGLGENSKERKIIFRTNEGLTGRVYTEQRPSGARRESTSSEWEPIDFQGPHDKDEAFDLTDAQNALVSEELTWIVSFPLKACEDGETLGVLNIDGLTDVLSDGEMWEMYHALRPKVAEFAGILGKLPKCRVTISVDSP
jgi:hypothetical protein